MKEGTPERRVDVVQNRLLNLPLCLRQEVFSLNEPCRRVERRYQIIGRAEQVVDCAFVAVLKHADRLGHFVKSHFRQFIIKRQLVTLHRIGHNRIQKQALSEMSEVIAVLAELLRNLLFGNRGRLQLDIQADAPGQL